MVKAAETIVFTPTVLGELLGGFSLGKRGQQNEKELQQFLDHPKVIFLTINAKTAEEYARIYQELKAKGRPIPTNDMWIAAMARQLEMAVFSYDVHFTLVDGLRIVQTTDDLAE